MTMAILLIASLVIIIFILAIMCIRRNAQVYSLKQQVNFLEFTLEQLAEKGKTSKQDLGENESGTGQPNKL
jgi:cell division protein FtsL